MSSPVLLLLAATLLFVLGLLAWQFSQRNRLRRQILAEHRDAEFEPVRFLPLSALQGASSPIRSAADGYLVRSAGRWLLRGRFPNSGGELRLEIPPGSRVGLIEKAAAIPGIPDLVRVSGVDEPVFLFSSRAVGAEQHTHQLHERLARDLSVESIRATPHPGVSAALIGLMAAALVCIAALVWLALSQVRDFGIEQLDVSPDGVVAVVTPRELAQLDPDGIEPERIRWVELGLAGGVSSLQLLTPERVLLGDYARGVIVDCDLSDRRCEPLPAFRSGFRFRRAFKFVLAPDGATVLATDAARNSLVQLDTGSGTVRRLDAKVCSPNRIRIAEDGSVHVADTNNHRLLRWPDWKSWTEDSPDTVAVVAGEPPPVSACRSVVETDDPFFDRPQESGPRPQPLERLRRGRIWVTDFEFAPGGGWWLLAADDGLRNADIARLRPDGVVDRRLDLPDGADPTQLLRVGERLLIADPLAAELLSFDLEGRSPEGYPLGAVGRELQARKQRHDRNASRFDALLFVASGLLGLSLLALVLAIRWRIQQLASLP